MDKFIQIRPIVLGIAVKQNKLLVSEGYDKIKKQYFYRCLGGGIEFLETSKDALKREFKEEINIDIEIKEFLGISENIFTFQGKKAHELVLFYNIEISDQYYKDEYILTEENEVSKAIWVDIDDFKKRNKILYPEEIFKYI